MIDYRENYLKFQEKQTKPKREKMEHGKCTLARWKSWHVSPYQKNILGTTPSLLRQFSQEQERKAALKAFRFPTGICRIE